MDRRFLNLHVLISHSPSCLNRDDMNMQKSARFGGVRRVRVSSQCLKRAIRRSDRYRELFGDSSVRTRSDKALMGYLRSIPRFDRFSDGELNLVINSSGMQDKVVTPWMVDEFEAIVEAVHSAIVEKGIPEDEFLKIAKKKSSKGKDEDKKSKNSGKGIDAVMKKAVDEFKKAGVSCTDIALSGRMCASGILDSIEGAMSLSHSITTHAMEAEIDWFTAMDDLTCETEETGAGHLNTQEFGSGVFYRYASINMALLEKNLGGDKERAIDTAAGFTELLSTIVPTGKQKSFASYSLADLVLAVKSDMPVSLHNAFERPVSGDRRSGLMDPSIKALSEYRDLVHSGYGLEEESAVFSIRDTTLTQRCNSLKELLEWIKR